MNDSYKFSLVTVKNQPRVSLMDRQVQKGLLLGKRKSRQKQVNQKQPEPDVEVREYSTAK